MFTWNLIDGMEDQQSSGCSEPLPHSAGGSRRAAACPECRGTRFLGVEWVERVREDGGAGGVDVVAVGGRSQPMPEAAFGEHLWCEACGTSFELPLELERH